MEEKGRILEFVEEKLFKDGISKTTMNDLAVEMKISKKTIYKYFSSKDALVVEIAKRFMEKAKENITAAIEKNANAVEKFSGILAALGKIVSKVSDDWMKEIFKSHPDLWREIDAFRTQIIIEKLSKIIEQGKSEGLFENYPTQIIMTIYIAAIRAVIQPDFVINNKFSLLEAKDITFKILMGGILTDKGKELFIQLDKNTL